MENPLTKSQNPNQQYNLKWTSHTNNMVDGFQQHLVKESFVDVTLACENSFIKAHKLVLSTCSAFFAKLFEFHRDPHPLVVMNGIKMDDLRQVIEFIYKGEVKVAETNLDSVLTLAENLQVKGLSYVRNKEVALKQEAKDAEVEKPRKKRKLSQNDENYPNENEEDEEEGNLQFRDLLSADGPMAFKMNARKVKLREKKTEDSSKIPRPPNAFMIFANEWRRKIAEENPNESNKEISIRLGTLWKGLKQDAKDRYYKAAKKADAEHKLKYPGYYYSPKEARQRKLLAALPKKSLTKFTVASNVLKLVMPSSLITDNDDSPKNSDFEEQIADSTETQEATTENKKSGIDLSPESSHLEA